MTPMRCRFYRDPRCCLGLGYTRLSAFSAIRRPQKLFIMG